ncbi:MAG: hypothetical protein J0M18_07335 [Ignavibacteria bacterium]|nr:hypothetical protein [Ignavibacteria bacterium]
MKLKTLIIAIFCICPIVLFAQDTLRAPVKKESSNPGGIFLAPTLSAVYPVSTFSQTSKIAAQYGVRLEYSSKKIYPFVIGALVEFGKHNGKDEFMNLNLLTTYETKTTAVGGSVDIILSKYLKTNFTIPFATLEVKYISATTKIAPETANIPGLVLSESQISYGGGLGFTLYIFDIYGKYSYSKSYSTFSINTRFHIPLLKF